MKPAKIIAILCIIFAVVSCTQPTATTPETPIVVTEPTTPAAPAPNVFVVNSAWEIVEEASVAKSSRQLSTDEDIVAEVKAYNSGHIDDQRRVYYDTVPAIAEAPNATLTMVKAQSYAVIKTATVKRSEFAATRDAMKTEAATQNALLYVEVTPPPYRFVVPVSPPAEKPSDPYYACAIYAVFVSDGAIFWEEHDNSDPGLYEFRIPIIREYVVDDHNRNFPADPVALAYGQKYTMPDGVEARQ